LTARKASATIRAVRASPQRLLTALVLIVWMAPVAGAIGTALHVALEHHAPRHGDHPEEREGLAHGVAEGHHHDLDAAADHGHEARVCRLAPTVSSPAPAVAAVSPRPTTAAGGAEQAVLSPPPRRAPTDPLFTTHCSLLL